MVSLYILVYKEIIPFILLFPYKNIMPCKNGMPYKNITNLYGSYLCCHISNYMAILWCVFRIFLFSREDFGEICIFYGEIVFIDTTQSHLLLNLSAGMPPNEVDRTTTTYEKERFFET